jgi:hypothetical protein
LSAQDVERNARVTPPEYALTAAEQALPTDKMPKTDLGDLGLAFAQWKHSSKAYPAGKPGLQRGRVVRAFWWSVYMVVRGVRKIYVVLFTNRLNENTRVHNAKRLEGADTGGAPGGVLGEGGATQLGGGADLSGVRGASTPDPR